MKLNIGFFLGSHYGKSKSYSLLVNKVSEWINESNHNIVFGGTESGLMLRLVSNLNNKNTKVISIIPKVLSNKYEELKYYNELIVTNDLSERTNQFIKRSDFFVVLPGGIGTLFELIELINKRILYETKKKIFLLNDLDYWKPLFELIKHMVKEKFLDDRVFENNIEIIQLDELKERVKNAKY